MREDSWLNLCNLLQVNWCRLIGDSPQLGATNYADLANL